MKKKRPPVLLSVRDSIVAPRRLRSLPQMHHSDFHFVRGIAGGATSSVYEVVRCRDGRHFAVKMLRRGEIETRIRFSMEAEALARIRHPNVVEVHGQVATPGGAPCIVMSLLEGETLRSRFDVSGCLSEPRAVALITQVLAGLDASHAAGILHRDLSPWNIFLGRSVEESETATRAILIDFGLAKLDAGAPPSELSRHHSARGNPAYMAPEQILGERVDARTDVYSVGTLLFEALAGRPPFISDDPDEVRKAQLERCPPALDRVAGVSSSLARIVARALEKHPDHRYASARAFAEALAATGFSSTPAAGAASWTKPARRVPSGLSGEESRTGRGTGSH